jgi:radical SAM superfamily enzyme YgiQ (UPF0313 family)
LKKSGMNSVFLGLESGDEKILEVFNKNIE